tara:strand:- start:837 stop:1037 length:201 start_codon:yes stop_codon:yes gene_type:complete
MSEKTYTVTRTITDIVSVKAKDDKEFMKLYNEGVVDEMLTIDGNRTERYKTEDKERGEIIYEKDYT